MHFQSVCEDDLDKVLSDYSSRFIPKQLDYSLSISMRDRNLDIGKFEALGGFFCAMVESRNKGLCNNYQEEGRGGKTKVD